MTTVELRNEILDLEEYFDFTNGVPVSDSMVKIWINRCIESGLTELRETKAKSHHRTTSSGNTKVLVEFYRESSSKDSYTVYASVITSYKQKAQCFVKL